MARHTEAIVVVDVESTCWEGGAPEGEEAEIIEMGICVLDLLTGERREKESVLVRPERSRVSPFCTQLTTLTQEQVEGGVSFREACDRLRKGYQTRARPWASYGDYDRRIFERQSRRTSVSYPFGPTHLNVKNLLSILLPLPHEVGMDQALAKLGLPLEGTHHRGHDDAWNIAAILWWLIARFRHEPEASGGGGGGD